MTIIERMDNPLAASNPLTLEIKSSFIDYMDKNSSQKPPVIFSGAAGLGSRDVRPDDIIQTFENMLKTKKKFFVLGIDHETALKQRKATDIRPKGTFAMRGHSVGGYGSVTTNKIIATIVADLFNMNVQAYPKYGSEKKGLPTTYYLTVSHEKIKTHNELEFVEFVPLNDVNAFNLENPLKGLQNKGSIFIQTQKTNQQEILDAIPKWAQKIINDKQITVYALDTVNIAKDVSSQADLIQRMQGIVLLGIFLKATPFFKQSGISKTKLMSSVKTSLNKYFGKRGSQVVQDNLIAVKRGFNEVFEVNTKTIKKMKKLA